MRLLFTLAFIYFIPAGNAQTPLISHKSHAGSGASFLVAASSNFGQIQVIPESWRENSIQSKSLEIFIPLNDSVILKRTSPARTTNLDYTGIKTDTLPNRNRYSVFEFRQKYEDSINHLGLEKAKLNYGTPELKSQEPINSQPAPAKKKKKSYLLFLFGITGGGMLLIRLFRRSDNVQQPIASL